MPLFKKRTRQADGLPAGYDVVDEGDRAVLHQLVSQGADLSKPRHVVHYLYVHTPHHQAEAAVAVRALGWEAEPRPPLPDYPNDWLVLAQRHGVVLTPKEVAATRGSLEQLATRLGGQYDGWEASI